MHNKSRNSEYFSWIFLILKNAKNMRQIKNSIPIFGIIFTIIHKLNR